MDNIGQDTGRWFFAADTFAERLRLSNAERERIEWLVEKHQVLTDAPNMRPSRLKPLLNHEGIEELVALHRAEAVAAGGDLGHMEFAESKRREWSANDQLDPPPLVTGDDLKNLGLTPGPQFKQLLDAVREAQLDATIATRDQALELVRQLTAN